MASLSTLKPFLPFILTFLIPRGLSWYHALKIAIKTRPQPRPLPTQTSRCLNILFFSICLFFLMSLPSYYSQSHQSNIFEMTNSRFHIPTDVLFTRLALIRPITPLDEALREKITTPIARTLYLRFGPHTLQTCTFCHPNNPQTYRLYHLPTNILLPHLLHLFLLGLCTSTPFTSSSTLRLRTPLILSALALSALDTYLTTLSPLPSPNSHTSPTPPAGLYWTALTCRPLTICLFDILTAALIFFTATHRLPLLAFFPFFSSTTEEEGQGQGRKERQIRALVQSNLALQTALTKLRAVSVCRSAVVREGGLKGKDDEYWRIVVGMEGLGEGAEGKGEAVDGFGGSVWEEDEVMEAVARVTGRGRGKGKGGSDDEEDVQVGQVDVERVRREAGIWVESVTRHLLDDNGRDGHGDGDAEAER